MTDMFLVYKLLMCMYIAHDTLTFALARARPLARAAALALSLACFCL